VSSLKVFSPHSQWS